LTCQDIETESSIDEKTIEFSDPADYHGLEQGEEEQAIGVWIFYHFPSLFRPPFSGLDTLRIFSNTLDKLGFGFVVCPSDLGRGVRQEEESECWISV
jgi:hypothetical protein